MIIDMTNEEAIEQLDGISKLIGYDKDSLLVYQTQTAIQMAIKALKATRPKGKWITHGDYPDKLICSECDSKFDMWWIDEGSSFCPNCGADMRGENNGK